MLVKTSASPSVPKLFPTLNVHTLPASGCRLMYPPGVGLGGSGTPVGVSLVVSLLVVVEEGPGNAGGALVLQANVVDLAVGEMTLFWVETVELGIVVGLGGRFVSGAGWAVGPGAGEFTDTGGVLVLIAGLVTALVVVLVAPRVRAGGGMELGEVALGLTAARMVVRRVTAVGVALFEVGD